MIGQIKKDYTFQNILGHGGMATVYLAEHNTLHQPVAIKVLNKEFMHNENIRKRFLAEARNIFKMSHPNIIKVTDLIDQDDLVAFVMEYIDGETLKEYLDKKGKLPDEEIKQLFTQMLDAVGYVHEQGLIHRDIKPSNFMISGKGVVKLLDFGIAKNTDSSSAEYTITGTSQNMGTPMYMSPEQVKSTKDVTAQSDIYSLGVVLWQMVMGRKPYETDTLSTWELQTKIVNDPLPPTGTDWDHIIKMSTQKEINNRQQTTNTISLFFQETENTKSFKPNFIDEKTIIESDIDNIDNIKNDIIVDKTTYLLNRSNDINIPKDDAYYEKKLKNYFDQTLIDAPDLKNQHNDKTVIETIPEREIRISKSADGSFIISGVSKSEIIQDCKTFFSSKGYSCVSQNNEVITFEKGSKTKRLLFGTFSPYFKAILRCNYSDTNECIIKINMESSGITGGLIGIQKNRTEINQIIIGFEKILKLIS
jgi:serine/threonine protein kinase